MKRRVLRKRYGYADRTHLPRSKVDLKTYEREVGEAMRWFRIPASVLGRRSGLGEESRLCVLDGWRAGRKPSVTALRIEKLWRASRRSA